MASQASAMTTIAPARSASRRSAAAECSIASA